jgi:uncharacterized integral membrane protein
MQMIFVGVLGLVTIAIVFALQNAYVVAVTFLLWKFSMSLALLLLITFVLGVLVSIATSLPSRFRNKRIIADQRKAIKEMGNSMAEDKEVLKPSKFIN